MNIIKSLIPFDLLVDTDMGVIKYVQISFPMPDDRFLPGIMNKIGPEHNDFLHYTLIHRSFVNPLSAIIKPEKMLSAHPDNLLERILSRTNDSIYKLSTTTEIMSLVCKSFFVQDSLKFDILCKDDIQKDYLFSFFDKHYRTKKVPASIIVGNEEDIKVNNYDNLFLKDIRDISKYNKKEIQGKNIIVANYDFNKEIDVETGKNLEMPYGVIDEYLDTNIIKFIDVYYIDENKAGVG